MSSEDNNRQAEKKEPADEKKRDRAIRDLPPQKNPKGGGSGSVFQKEPPLMIPPQGFINRAESGENGS